MDKERPQDLTKALKPFYTNVRSVS